MSSDSYEQRQTFSKDGILIVDFSKGEIRMEFSLYFQPDLNAPNDGVLRFKNDHKKPNYNE